MLLKKAECEQITRSGRFEKRIGSTVYTGIYSKEDSIEPLEDKILRMMKNDLKFGRKRDKIISLQTGRLPERGSA